METLVSDVLIPLAVYVLVCFLVTEVIKAVARAVWRPLGKISILAAIVIGLALAWGWSLSVLPDPMVAGFEYVAIVLTGLIIAGAASGVYEWIRDVFPWFAELNEDYYDERADVELKE